MAYSKTGEGPVILYGVNILQAIASGDRAQMQAIAEQAQAYLSETGNLSAALEVLKVEIAKSKGTPVGGDGSTPQPLYACAIQEAIVSADVGKMEEVAKQAEEQLANYGDVAAALDALKAELAK